jgi:hypothetical protein
MKPCLWTLCVLLVSHVVATAEDQPQPRFGVSVKDTPNGTGVYVTTVDEGSPASQMRRVEDGTSLPMQAQRFVISGFNGWAIHNSDQFVEAMAYAPRRCVFVVYDYERQTWDTVRTELHGEPKLAPAPQAIPVTGTAATIEPAAPTSNSGDGRTTFRNEMFFGQRAGTAETTGNITTYRRPWLNQHALTAETNGSVTEYYGPKFLWMQQKFGTAEDQGDKTIYRDAWGRKGATAVQEGDRTVYRDWLGRKVGTAREEQGRMVYRNSWGQKTHSTEGNSDPRRDGIFSVFR